MKKLLPLLFFAVLSSAAFAQTDSTSHGAEHFFRNQLSLLIGHTQLSEGIDASGKKKWMSLPSWGLNYNYRFNEHWAVGLHNDIVVESFEVAESGHGGGETLERNHPIASALVASFKPGHHFSFMLGPGEEFAHSGNLFLIRAGVDYDHHLSKYWEFTADLTNDFKVNAYNSWAIGMGITRLF